MNSYNENADTVIQKKEYSSHPTGNTLSLFLIYILLPNVTYNTIANQIRDVLLYNVKKRAFLTRQRNALFRFTSASFALTQYVLPLLLFNLYCGDPLT